MRDNRDKKNENLKNEVKDNDLIMSLGRSEALFDGILAIAMTLLVLDIKIPVQGGGIANSTEFLKALAEMHLTFIKYFTSFFILASIWIANNRELHYLKQTNKNHMWLNLYCMFFIVLIPFTTSVQDDFSGIAMAAILFHLNIFFVELFIFFRWVYIKRHKELTKKEITTDDVLQKQIRKSIALMIIPLIAAGSTFIIGEYSNFLYLLFFFFKRKV